MDNRLTWLNSAGVPLGHGDAATPGIYYAELPAFAVTIRDGFAVSLVWDAAEVADYTLQSANDDALDAWAAPGTGWVSQATALGTITAGAAVAATGNETFTRPGAGGAGDIPAGTTVRTAGGVAFTTDALAHFDVFDLTKSVGITAAIGGTAGNVGANTITVQPVAPFDPTITATNTAPTTGGDNGDEGDGEWQVVYAESSRWRVARNVTAGGVSTARYTVKGST